MPGEQNNTLINIHCASRRLYLFGLGGINPQITIDQVLTMELLASPDSSKGR